MGSNRFSLLPIQYHSACILFTLYLSLICVTDACYFRNCPAGGKRSVPKIGGGGASKECITCGPEGKGRCAGPGICCHKDGCVIGGQARVCMEENRSTNECVVKGRPCGASGEGRCVADGVCCNTSACEMNSRCSGRI